MPLVAYKEWEGGFFDVGRSRAVQEYSKYGRLLSDEKWGNTVHLVECEPQRLLAPRLSG